MKQKTIIILAIFAGLFSCKTLPSQELKNNQSPELEIVGNNADEHGCRASAGYTWSVLKKECVRIWEVGEQLHPVKKPENQEFTCTIIFSEDKKQVELFIVDEQKSIILQQDSKQNSLYTFKTYGLEKKGEKWFLSKENQIIYQN